MRRIKSVAFLIIPGGWGRGRVDDRSPSHHCFIYDPVFVALSMEYVSSLPKLIKYCKSDVLFEHFITIRMQMEDNKLELYFGSW